MTAKLPTITIGERTFTVLFPDLLRPLTPAERANLRESIQSEGMFVPIIVDEKDGIIDGINRATIASELGYDLDELPLQVVDYLTTAGKRKMVLDLHWARRHLTPDEQQALRQQRIARVAEARQEGKSLRTIAEAEGVSHQQIKRDLDEAATVTGVTVEPEGGKVHGRDGKDRPATKPAGVLGSTGPLSGRLGPASNGSAPDYHTPAPTAPKPDPEPSTDARGPQPGWLPAKSESEPAPPQAELFPVCDETGKEVPEEYHATFRNLGAARAIHKQLCLARRLVKEYCAGPMGGWAVARELWAHQTNAIREFLASLPYAMCPECAGAQKVPDPKRPKHRQRCESCEGKGYVNKARYENNLAGAAAAEVARQAEAEADPFADADAATVAPVASEPEEEDDNGPHEEDLHTRYPDRPDEEDPPGPTLAELDEIAEDDRHDPDDYTVPDMDEARACALSRRVPDPEPYEQIDH
jgi:hypothetical protein